jgi:lipoyl-dependent peroxiredoxin subunit C
MLTIGDKLPEFNLNACVSLEEGKQFQPITNTTNKGKWQVLFSWPLDFTFVCPTEISEFGNFNSEFEARNAKILGMSTDSQYSHLAWRNSHPELKNLPFPMLADIKRDLSNALGILHKEAGICLRATFIVDPSGTIRWASANDLPVGRSVPEVLRVLDALQTEKLTPCNWKKGEKTLN